MEAKPKPSVGKCQRAPFETRCSSKGAVDREIERFRSVRGKNAPQSRGPCSRRAPYGLLMRPARGPLSPCRGGLGALWTLGQSP